MLLPIFVNGEHSAFNWAAQNMVWEYLPQESYLNLSCPFNLITIPATNKYDIPQSGIISVAKGTVCYC